MVEAACVGKNSCNIKASNSAFGVDPCHGTTKYLAVDVECTPPPPPPPAPSCGTVREGRSLEIGCGGGGGVIVRVSSG